MSENGDRNDKTEREAELRALLQLVYERYHYDFRGYSTSSITRRVAVAQQRFGVSSVRALREMIAEDETLFSSFVPLLTIGVSDFFRDPSFFAAFRSRVVPVLATYPSPKIWLAGISTGEELYSTAIVLKEEGLLNRTTIYATDINGDALKTAERGAYAIDRIATFTENHRRSGATQPLTAHYATHDGLAVFSPSLRANVVFSDHSLATDTVFAEVQAVLCRNVLIYFGAVLRERALALLQESLCRYGFLGLGAKEALNLTTRPTTARPSTPEFQPIDPETRWYQLR